MRIGQGYDVHRFGEGDHLVLGGVKIPYHQGFVAHSDGDVLIHALCDALLGAAALGDIGRHFPDSDDSYKDIDSRKLLRRVRDLLSREGWEMGNADLTIVAQAPRMRAHIPAMVANLCCDLKCETAQVNIKATTTEGLGFAGRGEGIACYATVLIRSR